MSESFRDRFRQLAKGSKLKWIAAALAAAGLLLLLLPTGTTAQTKEVTTEERLGAVLSSARGVGEAEVMLTQDADGDYVGAIIVCGGADDAAVKLWVTNAVCAVTGLRSDRVEVHKRK